jgi:hypothetical protein
MANPEFIQQQVVFIGFVICLIIIRRIWYLAILGIMGGAVPANFVRTMLADMPATHQMLVQSYLCATAPSKRYGAMHRNRKKRPYRRV